MKIIRYILLCALPGLMFCIIPVEGTPFRWSWQLTALWLGGAAFTVFLSSWWFRAFYLLVLIRTATIMPNYDAYIAFITLTVFLAAVEGFSRIDQEKTMNAMCIAALLLLYWMIAQKLGWMTEYMTGQPAGPFNPDTGGIFLALCLPACLRAGKYLLLPLIVWGLVEIGTTTGIAAALCAAGVYAYLTVTDWKKLIAVGMALVISAGIWFWKIDPIENTLQCKRWIVWKHAIMSMRSEMFGRGLGSWDDIFPLLVSGDKRISGQVDSVITYGESGRVKVDITKNSYFGQAHNEYVQAAFELGIQALMLVIVFLGTVAFAIVRKFAPPYAAAGVVALAVSCFGFFPMHVAPTALLGCAWLGIWQRNASGGLK